MIAWSCGGGVQSVAIGVLIREGVLPRPDLSGIADTGRERQATWEYMRNHLQPYLDPVGVTIEVIPHTLAGRDLYSGNGDMLLPAFTGAGKLPAFCSGAWKQDVFQRWLRQKGVKDCTFWLGFSLDELHRCGKAHRPWAQPAYPLIDLRLTRQGCLRIIEAAAPPAKVPLLDVSAPKCRRVAGGAGRPGRMGPGVRPGPGNPRGRPRGQG